MLGPRQNTGFCYQALSLQGLQTCLCFCGLCLCAEAATKLCIQSVQGSWTIGEVITPKARARTCSPELRIAKKKVWVWFGGFLGSQNMECNFYAVMGSKVRSATLCERKSMIYFGLYLPLSRKLVPRAPSLLALHLIMSVPEIRAMHWGSQFNIRSIGLCLHRVLERDKATPERPVLGNGLGRAVSAQC